VLAAEVEGACAGSDGAPVVSLAGAPPATDTSAGGWLAALTEGAAWQGTTRGQPWGRGYIINVRAFSQGVG